MNKKTIITFILAFAVLIVTAFIFSNSFKNEEVSHNVSDTVTSIILPNESAESDTLTLLVRKAAHLVEFALLGLVVMCLSISLKSNFNKHFAGFVFFYVLAVAVLDEYIQSFFDRSSSVSDIIIDFIGAMLGFAVVWLLSSVIKRIKNLKMPIK